MNKCPECGNTNLNESMNDANHADCPTYLSCFDCGWTNEPSCRFGSPIKENEECIDTYMGCYHRPKKSKQKSEQESESK